MSQTERDLTTALMDAEFWTRQGQPHRIDYATILCLTHQLYQRAATGQARTLHRPSRLNPQLP